MHKVLIIEDDQLLQRTYQRLLGRKRYPEIHLQIVADGKRAAGWIIEHPDTAIVVVSTSKAYVGAPDIPTAETNEVASLIREIHGMARPIQLVLANSYPSILDLYIAAGNPSYTMVQDTDHRGLAKLGVERTIARLLKIPERVAVSA